GEVQRQGRISKCGSNELRSLLVEAGMVMLTRSKKWSKVKAWGLKIMRKKGMKKAALAVGRKLSVIMHKMLIVAPHFFCSLMSGFEILKKSLYIGEFNLLRLRSNPFFVCNYGMSNMLNKVHSLKNFLKFSGRTGQAVFGFLKILPLILAIKS
ncbi:transposase, partial [Candidatus Rhabdochlamydia sp. W815]